jgi:hypothetical protein
LQRIDELINEDVEMSVGSFHVNRSECVVIMNAGQEAPVTALTIYLVLDTNILLHHFDVVVQFVSDIERLKLPVTVIIPGVVIYELDRFIKPSLR